ncbi:MAG: serine/threonine protein kinase [Burkholderiaceae bacterium]|nr:serine/threonine protein kinase [Burkholderiaceae bacterium]
MPTRPQPDWQTVRQLFERLLALPAAARQAELQALAQSGTDAALLDEVRSLLAHALDDDGEAGDADSGTRQGDAAGAGFLATPASALQAAAAEPLAGQRLGAWRVESLLGRGGMGEVWRAQRADGAYQGWAAIKVLRAGLDSQRVLERFAQEQQALARLNHPHIARLLDAGRTPSGQPYFVMEAVDGRPIDQACATLALEARLALFLQLADAVAHAHRQLLVHRDLKPGNVLVAPGQRPGEPGQVKLLDFGIAKALDPLEGADAGATLVGERPFTPHYASPEQVRGEAVGTATDVYSLGVLLYVMLTGQRPYGRGATSAQEAARCVLEEAPARPSALTAETSGGPGLAGDAQWLATRRRLQGDLDNVLLKALDKSPDGRYPSVEAFAADIRAYLGGYPVAARPASWLDRAGKALRRNRLASAAAALGLAGLVGGLGLSLWQGQRAAAARDLAQARLDQVRAITHEVVLRQGDAITSLPGGLAVKEELLKGLIANLDRLADQMGDDADWQADLTAAYARLAELQGNDTGVSLKKLPDARRHAERAVALAERAWPLRRGDAGFVEAYLRALQILAQTHRAAGDPASGVTLVERARGLADQALPDLAGDGRRQVAVRRAALGLALASFYDQQSIASLNQPERALALLAETEAELKRLDAERADRATGDLLGTLHGGRAISHARLGQLEPARQHAQQAIRYRERAVEQSPADVVARDGLVTEATNGGVILLRLGDGAAALAATRVAWQHVQGLARENGAGNKWLEARPRVAQHHGRALLASGRPDDAAEAARVLAEAVALWQARADEQPQAEHPRRMLAWMRLQQARALWSSHAGAERDGLALARAQVPVLEQLAQAPKAGDAMLNLGEACLFLGQALPAERAAWFARSRTAYERAGQLRPLNGDHLASYRAAGGR